MQHLIDPNLLASYLERREDYLKHEPDYTKVLAARDEEDAWNRKYVNSIMGQCITPKTAAKDELANAEATFNKSFSGMSRMRASY